MHLCLFIGVGDDGLIQRMDDTAFFTGRIRQRREEIMM